MNEINQSNRLKLSILNNIVVFFPPTNYLKLIKILRLILNLICKNQNDSCWNARLRRVKFFLEQDGIQINKTIFIF